MEDNGDKNEQRLNRTATTLQLTFSSFIIMITLVSGLLWVRAELENHRSRIARLEVDVIKLDEFAGHTASNRFTSDQGKVLEERVHRLELWTAQAPPLWFRETFKEFKGDIKNELRILRDEVQTVRMQLVSLNKAKDDLNEEH